MLRLLSPVLLAAALALGLAGPAAAAFSGSNGKVVFVGNNDQHLYLDDPWDDDPIPEDLGKISTDQAESKVQAAAHTPAWSPDGTMFAYTAPVPDAFGLEHSAVFVRDADGDNVRQVSEPFELAPDTCTGQCDNSHVAWDIEPTWTPEGKVAYIRTVISGDESPKVGERGSTIYAVNPDGGGQTKIVRVPASKDQRQLVQAIVWPAASPVPYLKIMNGGGLELRKGSHTGPLVASGLIQDVDASPDGEYLGYSTISQAGAKIHVVELSGVEVESFGIPITEQPTFRFSPDGNAVMRQGCSRDRNDVLHCGLKLHRIDDPEGDVRPDDPVETPYVDLQQAIGQNAGIGQRGQFDVQGQDLPIIYLPGFLGSEIQCDGSNVWMPLAPPLHFQPIALSADGLTNQNCPGAGPTGKPVDAFMFNLADVYGHADEWLTKMNPPGGKDVMGWDWRKRPQESIKQLDDEINRMVADNKIGQKQGAKRVSLVGHSYGGLLMRLYVDDPDRAKKVARMLTVGAPFWGSTKPFFPLTFGIEAPGPAALDFMVGNEDIKDAMRNFGGAYHLLADDNFGQWLRVDGQDLDQAGVKQFLESVGAQGHLIDEGWKTHRDHLDGWFDAKGRIDVRAVVGVGLLTPRHVIVERDPEEGDANVGIRFGDGDETVPAHSAWQGEPGGAPMGDPIHLQRRCGVTHMDQTKDIVVQGAYAQFLLFGRTPRKLPAPDCPPEGKVIQVHRDVPIPAPVGAAARSLVAGGTTSLGDAAIAGLADVYRLPGATTIVTNDAHPVTLGFEAEGWSMTITSLGGSQQGKSITYGPLTGAVTIGPGAGEVSVNGVPVEGEPAGGGTGEGNSNDNSSGGGSTGGADPGHPSTGPTTDGRGTTTSGARAAALRGGTVKVSRKGVVTLRVKVGGPGSGRLALTARARGRVVTLGTAKVVARKAGEVRVTVRLSKVSRTALRRGRLKATAVLQLRLADGRTGRATAAVTLRR